MRKFKIAYWIVIAVVFIFFFVQNQDFFMEKKSLSYNIFCIPSLAKLEKAMFMDYKTPEMQIILFFLAFFLIGIALTFFYAFVTNFKMKRSYNTMSRSIEIQQERIEELERELEVFQGPAHSSFDELEQKEVIEIAE